MIRFIYNLVFTLVVAAAWPLALAAGLHPRHRRQLPGRLGIGTGRALAGLPAGRPRVWIHALSLGEVRSALPLVTAIRHQDPQAVVVLTAATASGLAAAAEAGAHLVLPLVFDFWPLARWFVRRLAPDRFVLVETDFWPNLLAEVQRRGVAAYLVNGRISPGSLARYRRFRRLFGPLFQGFARVVLQNPADVEAMAALGIPRQRIRVVGNLKFDAAVDDRPVAFSLPPGPAYLVAGSTHEGEEEILLDCLVQWQRRFPDLVLVLVPRQVARGETLRRLARARGFRVGGPADQDVQVMVVDRFGVLVDLYRQARLAFVGGSLVAAGGHNPLEAAACGVPVLFGPHMEDFAFVTDALVASGAAVQVADGGDLAARVAALLADAVHRAAMGAAGRALVARNAGGAAELARLILAGEGTGR